METVKTILAHYDKIKFTQDLSRGRHIYATYSKAPHNQWYAWYETDATSYICPYTGELKSCLECEVYSEYNTVEEQLEICDRQTEYISVNEMAARFEDCEAAEDCRINYWNEF